MLLNCRPSGLDLVTFKGKFCLSIELLSLVNVSLLENQVLKCYENTTRFSVLKIKLSNASK